MCVNPFSILVICVVGLAVVDSASLIMRWYMKIFSRLGLSCSLFCSLFRVFYQLLGGAWKVSRLPKPMVSIFGGARLREDDHYFSKAQTLAGRLADAGISVLTGGGPGVMEAASCGAYHSQLGKGQSIGISVRDLGEGRNPCTHHYLELDYFFARKWLLTRYSSAFVVFPGGYGTLDELAEVLTLIQTKKLGPAPIVLVGKEYWGPFIDWLCGETFKHGLISQDAMEMFTVTDDLDHAFRIVENECRRCLERE